MVLRPPRSGWVHFRQSRGWVKPSRPDNAGKEGSGPTDHKGKLAARAVAERRQHLGGRAAEDLFVKLGELTRDRDLSVGQRFRHQRERFLHSIWRLERDRRPMVADQAREQPAHLARLARQVAEKGEARSSIARDGERRRDRAWPRDRYDCVSSRPRRSDQRLTGV